MSELKVSSDSAVSMPMRNLLSILIVAFLAGMPEHLSMQLVSAILIQLIPRV